MASQNNSDNDIIPMGKAIAIIVSVIGLVVLIICGGVFTLLKVSNTNVPTITSNSAIDIKNDKIDERTKAFLTRIIEVKKLDEVISEVRFASNNKMYKDLYAEILENGIPIVIYSLDGNEENTDNIITNVITIETLDELLQAEKDLIETQNRLNKALNETDRLMGNTGKRNENMTLTQEDIDKSNEYIEHQAEKRETILNEWNKATKNNEDYIVAFINELDKPSFAKIGKEERSGKYCVLSDDEKSISIDTNPYNLENKDSSTRQKEEETIQKILRINQRLGLPDSLITKMDKTSALDGRQTETYEDITISWAYHPSRGLEIIYELK